MHPIYLDYASTAPTDPRVLEAMQPYFWQRFGNAASPHSIGQKARKAVEDSRSQVAAFLGAKPAEIVFTSSATESNNHAIFSTAHSLKNKGKHLIVSAMEHSSVLKPVDRLREHGFEVTFIQPGGDGLMDPSLVESLIRPDTILIAVHHANNEIGVIEPVEQIGPIARRKGVYFLVDAAQTAGHVPVNVVQIGCDLLSLSAHKFYGPLGVGVLYVRQGITVDALLLGGDQEHGQRASTQNLPAMVGLAKAMELCHQSMIQEAFEQSRLRDRIIHEVLEYIDGAQLNGHRQQRLPNNINFSFENIKGEELVAALDMAGIAVSQGSACTSGRLNPSHVLKAIGLCDTKALSSLRVSLGRWTTSQEVEYFLQQLKLKISKLQTRKP